MIESSHHWNHSNCNGTCGASSTSATGVYGARLNDPLIPQIGHQQSVHQQCGRASNTVVSSTDSNLATRKVATKRFTQAVAERIMAGLKKLQARLDEINTKLDGTKKGVSDRRDMMMKRDVPTSVAEAEKLIEESARATGKLGVNGSETSLEHARRTSDIATVRQHEGQLALNVV